MVTYRQAGNAHSTERCKRLNVYEGTVVFAGQELTIPVLGGSEIQGILLGLPWLENRRLVVDRKAGVLTLSED